ncbi:CHASE domain-containing protein [Cognatazoarcus halotolerans]|uniref:CHASE domain-containing protein n=1 Tax=Cognatazoarcus halotolerans TaxID=2686016 RepID=UPI0013594092|nr:CHASE domain-containing protein [Cognatazoarcus halotolerans]MBX3678984.1 CHASE domain-containing protein [Rhodocyclaceae bacterium]MCB1898901.1 CHASE domain-containing protein [Rhodocyclaceae bacterium]MCP5309120.1 CHASE domain-containing protein [Zoogloeaceae bacterium]
MRDQEALGQRGRRWSDRGYGKPTMWPTVVVAIASVVLIFFAFSELRSRQSAAVYDRLASASNSQALRIRERVASYALVLRGASALFATRGDVSRAEWHTFVSGLSLYRDYPGVLGVGFARNVPLDQIATVEQRARSEGFRQFRVWPRGQGESGSVSSIVYLEPANWRNLRAYGYDMFTEPVRREAMLRALRSGEPAMTGKLTLVQETETEIQAGVILYLPVFAPGIPTAGAIEGARGELLGWAYSPFRMGELVDGALGRSFVNLRLRIYDDAEVESSETLLFDSLFGNTVEQPVVASYATPILMGGRVWRMRFDAAPGFGAGIAPISRDLVALGLLFTLLTSGTWALSNMRRRAVKMQRLTESLRASEERYSVLVNLSRDGVAALDDRLRFTFANPRIAGWLNTSAEDLIGRGLADVCRSLSGSDVEAILQRLREGEGLTYESVLEPPNGEVRVVLASDHPVFGRDGAFRGATLMLTDITDRKASEERIRFLATHDMLTGLPNRFVVHDRVQQALGLARRYKSGFGLLFIDLDRFKEVNDTFGHAVGDQVLREAVARVKGCLRDSDTLGRMGGDEFVVLLPQIENRQAAINVANKIVGAFAQPIRTDQDDLNVSVSIGLAICPEDGTDENVLMRRADAAMYRVKQRGRNNVAAFDEGAD